MESEHNEVDGMKKGVDSKGEVMHIYIAIEIVRIKSQFSFY